MRLRRYAIVYANRPGMRLFFTLRAATRLLADGRADAHLFRWERDQWVRISPAAI